MTTELRKSINSTLNKLGFISPKRGNFLEGSGIFEGIRVYFNTHSLTIRNKDTRTKILYPKYYFYPSGKIRPDGENSLSEALI